MPSRRFVVSILSCARSSPRLLCFPPRGIGNQFSNHRTASALIAHGQDGELLIQHRRHPHGQDDGFGAVLFAGIRKQDIRFLYKDVPLMYYRNSYLKCSV